MRKWHFKSHNTRPPDGSQLIAETKKAAIVATKKAASAARQRHYCHDGRPLRHHRIVASWNSVIDGL
jgi:hypothetical protein